LPRKSSKQAISHLLTFLTGHGGTSISCAPILVWPIVPITMRMHASASSSSSKLPPHAWDDAVEICYGAAVRGDASKSLSDLAMRLPIPIHRLR
jgi:hypothetical protein